MRKLLLTVLVLFSLTVSAVEYRAMHLYSNLRIVIIDIECNLDGLQGHRASAQRLDKLHVIGCWYPMKEHPHMIHIDWLNGDWSELPYEKFELIGTSE